MFEVGQRYKRKVILKRKQEDIAYYACVYVSKNQSFFEQYDNDGNLVGECLVPNKALANFDLIADNEAKLNYLYRTRSQLLDDLKHREQEIIAANSKLGKLTSAISEIEVNIRELEKGMDANGN